MISANGVAHISRVSETHPYFYVGTENTITCSASNFTSLSQLNLVYVDQSTSSIVFNAGCDMDEFGVWSSNNTHEKTALRLKIDPTADSECQPMHGDLTINFTVEIKTSQLVEGYFYCQAHEGAVGELRESINLQLTDVKGMW